MIGAVRFKVTSEYEARIYMVGTYDQIDWTNERPCILGESYACYNFKNEKDNSSVLKIVEGLDGKYGLQFIETKRYVLRLIHNENAEVKLPRFQNENNKFIKLERDRDSITFQFINYLSISYCLYDGFFVIRENEIAVQFK